jgi:phage head maturation protease
MSFGFTIASDGVDWDEETRTSRITSISKLFDVSAVSIPANPNTEIHARSYLDGVIEERRMQREALQRAEQEKAKARRAKAAAALELVGLR